MHIYFLSITDPAINHRDSRLLQLTSKERQEKILRYRFDIDKKLSLYAEAISRMGLSKAADIPVWNLSFCYKEFQKPTVADTPQYDYSYSHTHSAILCAIAEAGKIGADIEGLREAPYNVMKRVFHPDEIQYVQSATPSSRDVRFFEIWTRKEAYTKYLGIGLAAKLTHINTLSPTQTLHYKTWRQDDYICSVYSDETQYSEPLILTETAVYEYLIHALY